MGALPKVEALSICVLRDALAYQNAAADSVFAVQGLGSHPVLLSGSDAQKREWLPLVANAQALFAFAFLGERPSATGWLGIGLIAAGAVIIATRA